MTGKSPIIGLILGICLAAQPGQADAGECVWQDGFCRTECPTFSDPVAYMEQQAQEAFDEILGNGGVFRTCQVVDVDGRFGKPSFFVLRGGVFQAFADGGLVSGSGCPTQASPNFRPLNCTQGYDYFYASGSICTKIGFRVGTIDCVVDEQEFVIRLSPLSGIPESSILITSVEPDKTTETLVARVFDADTEELEPNVDVRLELDVIAFTGGHLTGPQNQHDDENRPKGKFISSSGQLSQDDTVLTGNTGANGLQFTFKAPAPAGDHTITASCTDRTCMPDGPTKIEVGVDGLFPIPAGTGVYELIGQTPLFHPDNNYLKQGALSAIDSLAALYNTTFPGDPILHLNDASLIKGGVFDLAGDWMPEHHEHRRGTVIDIRANPLVNPNTAIPTANEETLKIFAFLLGMDARIHRDGTNNRHFHVRIFNRKE